MTSGNTKEPLYKGLSEAKMEELWIDVSILRAIVAGGNDVRDVRQKLDQILAKVINWRSAIG